MKVFSPFLRQLTTVTAFSSVAMLASPAWATDSFTDSILQSYASNYVSKPELQLHQVPEQYHTMVQSHLNALAISPKKPAIDSPIAIRDFLKGSGWGDVTDRGRGLPVERLPSMPIKPSVPAISPLTPMQLHTFDGNKLPVRPWHPPPPGYGIAAIHNPPLIWHPPPPGYRSGTKK